MADGGSRICKTSDVGVVIGEPKLPFIIPRIVVHRVSNLVPEPLLLHKKRLATPPKCYKSSQRMGERLAWGSRLYNAVLNLEEIMCLLSPKVVKAVADQGKNLALARPAPSVDFDTIFLSLACNREHDRKTKREKWRSRVQSSVERKIGRLQSLIS